jgi:hypothetical protein
MSAALRLGVNRQEAAVQVQVLVSGFLSFVTFPIPERRIKDSRANNLQVEINSQG